MRLELMLLSGSHPLQKRGELVHVGRRPLGSDEDRDGANIKLTVYCALPTGKGAVSLV